MAYPLKGSNSSDVATLDFAMLGNARQLKANKQVVIDFWNQYLQKWDTYSLHRKNKNI